MKYKTSHEIPEIYYRLKRVFNIDWSYVVIAYGDTVYSRDPIPGHLLAHEKVHLRQQEKMGVEAWWDKYIEDPKFRLEQELEAIRVQVDVIKSYPFIVMNKSKKKQHIDFIARQLSGGMYGGIISYQKALELFQI